MNIPEPEEMNTENLDQFPKSVTTPITALLDVVRIIHSTLPDSKSPFAKALASFKGGISNLLKDETKFAEVSRDCEQALLAIAQGPLSELWEGWSPGGQVSKLLASVDPESVTAADPMVSDEFRKIFKP